jgi:hypothetical protein
MPSHAGNLLTDHGREWLSPSNMCGSA